MLMIAGGCKEAPPRPAIVEHEPDASPCARVPKMALQGAVTDSANILTAEEEEGLSQRLAGYERRTKHQMVVATVSSLNGDYIEPFATCLGNQWGIGRKEQDDGILILIAPNEKEMRIATGKGMEKMLTDSKASEVIKQMAPHFENNDYAGGLSTGIGAIAAQTGDMP